MCHDMLSFSAVYEVSRQRGEGGERVHAAQNRSANAFRCDSQNGLSEKLIAGTSPGFGIRTGNSKITRTPLERDRVCVSVGVLYLIHRCIRWCVIIYARGSAD